MLRASRICANANRNVTVAPSDHSPITIAPTTATSISTLMSNDITRVAAQARRAV
jgi:hypothetical protein